MFRKLQVLSAWLAVAGGLVAAPIHAQTKKPGGGPGYGAITVGNNIRHDVSEPLRNLVSAPQPRRIVRLPSPVPPADRRGARLPLQGEEVRPELVNGGTGAATTLTSFNLAGVGNYFTGPDGSFTPSTSPSDATGAVGTTQYVQFVDDAFAIFSKATGNAIMGPFSANTLWFGFGGLCEADGDGQPTVNFDKLAKRWVVSQHAISGGPPHLQCLAVSTTDDATGTWNRYAFDFGYVDETWIPQNARLGVWPDGYYMSFEMYSGTTYVGPRICALQRASMLTGASAGIQCVLLAQDYSSPTVADVDSALPPPAGTPAYFAIDDPNYYAINVWKLHVDWTDSQKSTLGLPVLLGQTAFNPACGTYSIVAVCVPQPNGKLLDAVGGHLNGRMAYRNYGDHQSLLAAETVETPTQIRYYEMRIAANGDLSMYQQGNVQANAPGYRFLPSIAADRAGNIATAYNLSSSQLAVGQYVASRMPSDPTGSLGNETLLNPGQGSQTTVNWDKRSSLTVDPIDDCTFYYTQQYEPMDGTNNWSTQIEAFQLGGCEIPISLATVPAGLKVSASGIGASLVEATPFSSQFPVGSTVTLNTTGTQPGTPGVEYVFSSWSDGGKELHTIKVPQNATTYTANFNTKYRLTTAVALGGHGTVAPTSGGFYPAGSTVNLTVTPQAGYAFSGWTGAVASPSSATTSIAMTGPQTVTASFTPLPTTVNAALTGQSGASTARTWSFAVTNAGPGVANTIQINSFALTQTAGTACKPVVLTKLPLLVGNIAIGGTLNTAVSINFSSCVSNARFSLAMGNTENAGASHSVATLTNLAQ